MQSFCLFVISSEMQRGPELVFDMVKSAACSSALYMKESQAEWHQRGPEGRRSHLV